MAQRNANERSAFSSAIRTLETAIAQLQFFESCALSEEYVDKLVGEVTSQAIEKLDNLRYELGFDAVKRTSSCEKTVRGRTTGGIVARAKFYNSICPETDRVFICETGVDNNLAEVFEHGGNNAIENAGIVIRALNASTS